MGKVGMWFYKNDGGACVQNKIVSKLKHLGHEVINDFDMRQCYVLNGNVYTKSGYNLCDLDVFYHMNADEQTEFQTDILKVLSASKVKVFNDYLSFDTAQDKMFTNFLLRQAGINVAPALFVSSDFDESILKKVFSEWGTVLVKPRRNHCGNGIVRFNDFESFNDFKLATYDFYNSYYIEKYIDFGDHDYRVEIFDGNVLGGYSRKKRHSFKSNVGSGGAMLDIPVEKEQIEIALKCAQVLNITTTIVDMVRSQDDGQLYVLEVNPIMGVFVESGMKSGERMIVHDTLPQQFCYDDKKIDAIVNYMSELMK